MFFINVAAQVYKKITEIRNRRFDNGFYKIVDCGKPVISIGNISAGGVGKTPFVIMLARELIEMGIRPAIIGRGYKKAKKGEVIVSDGTKILSTPAESGDEMYMIAQQINAPIIVNDKKYLAAISAVKIFNPDVLIVDDGFQHRWLKRDLDIVLIDSKTIEKPYVFPKGMLREPVESLSRADIICLSGNVPENNSFKKSYVDKPTIQVFPSDYQYISLKDKKFIPEKIIAEARKGSVVLSGIANPDNFISSLRNKKFSLIANCIFADHFKYKITDIKKAIKICNQFNCKFILTTEKDSVKINEFANLFENNGIFCIICKFDLTIYIGKSFFLNMLREKFVNR